MSHSVVGPSDLVRQGMPVEHLKIGECILTRRPALITTVLGSCVSVSFFDPKMSVAAIFHAMLPNSALARGDSRPCMYVDAAVDAIMSRFDAMHIRRDRLQVKLFGGGFTIEPERKRHVRELVDVGKKNVEAARAILSGYGLKASCEDVLGVRGRKLFFNTSNGRIWMKFINDDDAIDPCPMGE